mmetsp:Transcript_40765/g.110260  ORF Transcript_40765/g.110260 Transcript_40765/m.110260 type:complete len:232 (+) Transcript_40765:176-871(+)
MLWVLHTELQHFLQAHRIPGGCPLRIILGRRRSGEQFRLPVLDLLWLRPGAAYAASDACSNPLAGRVVDVRLVGLLPAVVRGSWEGRQRLPGQRLQGGFREEGRHRFGRLGLRRRLRRLVPGHAALHGQRPVELWLRHARGQWQAGPRRRRELRPMLRALVHRRQARRGRCRPVGRRPPRARGQAHGRPGCQRGLRAHCQPQLRRPHPRRWAGRLRQRLHAPVPRFLDGRL